MAYATASDVAALNRNRTFTGSSFPTTSEVDNFLALTAAEIDGVIRSRGYTVPVPTTATSALKLLEYGNALGAAWMVEQGAKTSVDRDMAYKVWQDWLKTLSTAELAIDDPVDEDRGSPRYGSSASSQFAWPAVDSNGSVTIDV